MAVSLTAANLTALSQLQEPGNSNHWRLVCGIACSALLSLGLQVVRVLAYRYAVATHLRVGWIEGIYD